VPHHDRGGQDHVSAIRQHPEARHALLRRQILQLQDPALQVLAVQGIQAFDGVQAAGLLGQIGQHLHVAAARHQPVQRPGQHALRDGVVAGRGVLLQQRLERRTVGTAGLAARRLEQADGAQGVGVRRHRTAVLHQDRLHAAAAQVQQQGAPLGQVCAGLHRTGQEPGLLGSGDHLDRHRRHRGEPLDHSVAIGRLAQGGGGHGPDPLHAVLLAQVGEATQRGFRRIQGLRPDAALGVDVQAQADRGPVARQHHRLAPLDALDDLQAQGVGAQIDYRAPSGAPSPRARSPHAGESSGRPRPGPEAAEGVATG
jgi:hypothetical protein